MKEPDHARLTLRPVRGADQPRHAGRVWPGQEAQLFLRCFLAAEVSGEPEPRQR